MSDIKDRAASRSLPATIFFIFFFLSIWPNNIIYNGGLMRFIFPLACANDEIYSPAPAIKTGPEEDIPPAGGDNILSISQIRYCVYQKQRIEIIRGMVDEANTDQTSRFNRMIDDYNDRCSKFKYLRGHLDDVKGELARVNNRLNQEARKIFASWSKSAPLSSLDPATNITDKKDVHSKPAGVLVKESDASKDVERMSVKEHKISTVPRDDEATAKKRPQVRKRIDDQGNERWIDDQGNQHWSGSTRK